MASTVLLAQPDASYISSGNSLVSGTGISLVTPATEALAQVRLPKSGKLRRLRVVVSGNTATTATCTMTLRINGVATALAVSIPPGFTGEVVKDDVDIDVSAGDLMCYQHNKSASGGQVGYNIVQVDYETNDGIHTAIHTYSGRTVSISTASDDRWTSLGGVQRTTIDGWISSSPSWESRDLLYAAGTITSIRAVIAANTSDADTTIVLVVNDVDTALQIVVPAGSGAGTFRVTGAVTINPGDSVSWRRKTAGRTSGSIQHLRFEAVFESSDGAWDIIGRITEQADASNGNNFPAYFNAAPRPYNSATETFRQIRLPEAGEISFLRSKVYTTGAPAPWPVVMRLNGGSTALENMHPASGGSPPTAFVINTTDTVSISADARVAIMGDAVNSGSLPSYRGVYAVGLTVAAATTPEIIVDTTPGELEFTGGTPTLWVDQFVTPETGGLVITGGTPLIATSTEIDVGPGALEITGGEPSLWLGVAITPAPDSLIIAPGAPEVIIYTESAAITSQQVILAAGEMIPDARAGQQAVLAAGYVIPPVAVSQQVILVMADAHPCASRLCQVWLLRRRDGEEFAFTSHDEPVRFMGRTFSPCASLNPSAVEAASDMAAVGNMELSGIIDAEGITEFDLYAGKFDDCRVDVWEVPWFGAFPHPIRLASGTMGSVSHGRDGFKGEVLGPGAKMQQQSVTQVVTAACRFTFGDARCTKDLGPLTETGTVAAVSAAAPFRTFRSDALIGSGPEGYFSRGVVTWTSGPNEGVRSEVKEYDPATGTVVLWTLLPSPAEAGDAFTISPGCTLAKDGDMGCVYWANLINFGGFPDVPGDDATSETPIAKV